MTAVAVPGICRVEHVMGMPVVVDIRDEDADETVAAEVFDWFRFVDATFSTYKETSEVSRLNRGELALADAHPDVKEIVGRSEALRLETDGYFDARARDRDYFDPSGLVKGWSVDRAASLLEHAGMRNYAVNAGGDVRVRGRAVPELAWRIGIAHPLDRLAVCATIEATELAVATSGEYARGRHVFDPHTNRPPDGVLSVTIAGRELATADAYATAAFAMGAKAAHWTARLRGYEAMTVLADGSVLKTPGFPG